MSISAAMPTVFQNASVTMSRAHAPPAQDAKEATGATLAADVQAGSVPSVDSRDLLASLLDASKQPLYSRDGVQMQSTSDKVVGSLVNVVA